jgi:hypothetical protein
MQQATVGTAVVLLAAAATCATLAAMPTAEYVILIDVMQTRSALCYVVSVHLHVTVSA